MAKKHTEKFDAADIPLLLLIAKGEDYSNEPDRYVKLALLEKMASIKSLTQLQAQHELEIRFRRIIATLINVCITGRPNYWSSYQKTFLRYFSSKNTPITDTAAMLKRELSLYEKDELFSTGQLAVLIAIQKCETNFASTIVVCLKDLIYGMIKDGKKRFLEDINDYEIEKEWESDSLFEMMLDDLTDKERLIVDKITSGKNIELPDYLKEKLSKYYEEFGNV
jgi:hypothetical protein